MNKFIETVVKNKEVFYLEVEETFAICGSEAFYIEATKEAIPVALFWTEEANALACKTEEWENGVVKSLPLEEFIEICFGLQIETMAIGIDFAPDLSGGEELIPVEVAKALIEEIERTDTPITFSDSFDSLEQIKELLSSLESDEDED